MRAIECNYASHHNSALPPLHTHSTLALYTYTSSGMHNYGSRWLIKYATIWNGLHVPERPNLIAGY